MNTVHLSGSRSCTRRDCLGFTALIAQVTSSFEGDLATKDTLQCPNLVAVKHLKDSRLDNTVLTGRSNTLGSNGDIFQTHHSTLYPFLSLSLKPSFPWMCKMDADGGKAVLSHPDIGQGLKDRYNQGWAMTLTNCLAFAYLVSEPSWHKSRNPMEIKPAKVCLRNEVKRRTTELRMVCGWMWCASGDSGNCCASGKRKGA